MDATAVLPYEGLFRQTLLPLIYLRVHAMRKLRSLIISPFDPPGRRVFDAVRRALKEAGVEVWDIDVPPGAGLANAITNAIRSSDFLVVDVTRQNPNVLYELGFAHALRKSTIIITSSEGSGALPSDLSGFDYIVYEPSNLRHLVDKIKTAAKNFAAEESQNG
jgi:hypothetical protein